MSNQKKFWIQNFEEGYYDKVIQNGLTSKKGLQSNWHNCTYLKVKNLIEKSDIHLDYACGSGTFIGRYLNNDSTGVDISPLQIEYAKENFGKSVNFYTVDDFQKINVTTFDVITVLGLIEFLSLEETKKLTTYLTGMLNEDGKIIFTTPNYSYFFRFIQSISKYLSIKDYKDVVTHKYTKNNLTRLLSDEFPNTEVKRIVNFGIFASILSHSLGLFFEGLFEKIFKGKVGFILLAEVKK